jgi:hypothetical protein
MRGDLRDILVRTLDKREFSLQVRDKTSIPDLKDAVASTTLIASESQVIRLFLNSTKAKIVFAAVKEAS